MANRVRFLGRGAGAISAFRRAQFEALEPRQVMAPLGAMPDDTGDYMLGDALVTVVLMESDPNLPGADVSTEDWNSTTIAATKAKVQQAMDWWKQTLSTTPGIYYNPAQPLLDFKFDFTWADNPVETPYEPINRYSGLHTEWVKDFLAAPDVNFLQSGDIYKDVKAFNNFQRERYHTDWAFTIFVVNSTNDSDDFFPLNPSPAPGEANYRGAFTFLGGEFEVIPSDRPAVTFAHETGHIFYALDEYSTGHSYYLHSGYYNAQNLNGARDNPTPNFLSQQQPSIMATGTVQNTAWLNFVTSDSSRATIGWVDSDGDGVIDVLDVPFELQGSGKYNAATHQYSFTGTSRVRTAPNQNTFGGQYGNLTYNDISINKIRQAQYRVDGGNWTTITNFAAPAATMSLNLTIDGLTPGPHTIHIRTFDSRTGAASESFVATINADDQPNPPQAMGLTSGITGFAFSDANSNGVWDAGEIPLSNWSVQLQNDQGDLLAMQKTIDAASYAENTSLNTIIPGVTMNVVGTTASGTQVLARTSSRGVGKIFYAAGGANETFATVPNAAGTALVVDRQLKIDFAIPTTMVSLTAISAAVGSGTGSVARLSAYDAAGNLLGRYTTGLLNAGQSEVMAISRAAGDIKYVVATGHLETEVMFNALVVGPTSVAQTNAEGAFALTGLTPGTYYLQAPVHANYTPVGNSGSSQPVTISAGSGVNNLYFAFHYNGNPWHNEANPLDTNGTASITAFDAILVINFLNLHPIAPPLIAAEATPNNFLDVNDDGRCTAFDALAIINYLNLHPVGAPESAPESTEVPPSSAGNRGQNSSGGEESLDLPGLTPPAPAQTADEYFARHPFHLAGNANKPCGCAHCMLFSQL